VNDPANRMPGDVPSAPSQPTITVCMIVRDEACMLPRCLASLDGVYDELCVVDTGSVDDTVALVRRMGGKVRTFTKCNGEDGKIVDFAAARNAALAMAGGDWILQIDADEIVEEGAALIRERVRSAKDCLGVTLRSDGAQWVSGRLFRRDVALGYRSPIHEYLEHDGSFELAREIVIHNLPDKTGKEGSAERNIRITRATLAERPDEGRLWHYLGNEHRKAGHIAEAIECYARALALGNFRIGRYHTVYYLGCCHLIKGSHDAAIEAGHRAIAIDPRYAEAYCLIGDALYLKGERRDSREWYVKAIDCGKPPEDAILAVQAWAYDEHPRQQIARIDATATMQAGGGG
jgi:glycosyltransferase involved in cell wall biosynthesis